MERRGNLTSRSTLAKRSAHTRVAAKQSADYCRVVGRTKTKIADVVSLAQVREKLRLAGYQTQIATVLEANRRAITRLFHSGAIFSKEGAKAGRDLLLAHQHLLRVVALLEQLSDQGPIPAPRKPQQLNAVYNELDGLLERTSELTDRTGAYLARLKGEH